jgi:acyl-CoA synthetase (AMP-forming)/AMP-acid ligase II
VSFEVDRFVTLVAEVEATHVAFLAPTMLRRFVDAVIATGHRPPALASIVVGGAPLYAADLARALEALGPIITQIYGQGEAPMTIAVMPAAELPGRAGDAERLASCGRPFTGVQVRVVDGEGHALPSGADGEVCVAGDVVMNGYWRNDAANRAALRDGWLHTGDIGHFDGEGYIQLTDRAKDVIITGGSNVYPREVEEVLLTFPGVREAAVVGAPDPEWGEAVWAYVVLDDGVDEDAAALVEHTRGHLASFKKPRHVVFLEELPKNSAGKVLKRQLSPASSRAVPLGSVAPPPA